MDSTHHPLRDGNRFQRVYYRWALPYYERIGARDGSTLREQVEAADRFLYTRQGLGAWIGFGCGFAGTAAGLRGAGMPWWLALVIALMAWVSIGILVISAWLKPQMAQGRPGLRHATRWGLGLILGGLGGFVVGHWLKTGRLDLVELGGRLLRSVDVLLPALLGTAAGMALLFWAVARASQQAQARRLAQAQLLAERDAARASAAETELRLLQAQIHPHFVFNTLATLQHWVDKRDGRAGPLLRELTGFLRRSTEMLGRPQVPLAEEAQAVAHYLAILQARQGERLRYAVRIDPATAAQPLPPGLLLTLVENAVEHGLETKIGGGSLSVHSATEGEAWWLRVDDDGLGLAPGAQDHIGLSNLRQRLQQHFAGRASFTLSPRAEGGTRAEIRFQP